jgi:biopolymer transport protein ExbD
MAFGMQDTTTDTDGEVMNEINMTPLVDVMLVLLIIFIITVPVMKHAVQVELPVASSQPQAQKPSVLQLSVDASGTFFLDKEAVDPAQLATTLKAQSNAEPQPELHIQGDKAARYEFVALAMSMAKQAGLRKIAFVTEPAR